MLLRYLRQHLGELIIWGPVGLYLAVRLIVPLTHEGGHAIASILRGGQILHWLPFASPPVTLATNLDDPVVIASGSIGQIVIWLLATAGLMLWLRWMPFQSNWPLPIILIWCSWSYLSIREPYIWSRDIHLMPQDPAHFIEVTHLNPQTISDLGITLCAVLAVAVVLPCMIKIVRAIDENLKMSLRPTTVNEELNR
jgi:hypothetical protein